MAPGNEKCLPSDLSVGHRLDYQASLEWPLPHRHAVLVPLTRGRDASPHARTERQVRQRIPTAIAIANRSFNAASEHLRGIGNLGLEALRLFYGTAESREGVAAFQEKRPPDFGPFGR